MEYKSFEKLALAWKASWEGSCVKQSYKVDLKLWK